MPDAKFAEWKWWRHIHRENEEPKENEFRRKLWKRFLGFRSNRELLLYAQRAYLDRRFPDYDPSQKAHWESHNRPWDYDHLLASYYLRNKKKGDFKWICDEWVNTIGNLRAWPMKDNRSEQDETAMQKLGNEPARMQDSFLLPGEDAGFSGGEEVRMTETAARQFVEACRARLFRIYQNWHEALGISGLLATSTTS